MKVFAGFIFALAAISTSFAGESCSGGNENSDARCSISCQTGQTAMCVDGTGSNTPSCECQGYADDSKSSTLFFPVLTKKQPLGSTKHPVAGLSLFSSINAGFSEAAAKLEETNVLAVVNTKLGTLPDSALSNSCSNVLIGRECHMPPVCERLVLGGVASPSGGLCRDFCTSKYENRCTQVVGKLSASYPFQVVEPINVKIVEPNWKDIPSSILGYRETYTNCTAVQQSVTFRHTETTRTGTKVTKTKTIKTGQKIGANVGFKFTVISGGGNVEFNKEVSITEANEETEESTRSLERTDPLLIPAMSEVVFDHKWIRRDIPVKYTGTVVLDAPLSPNLEGKTMLSQALLNVADRTFAFEGIVTSSLLLDGQSVARQRNMTAKECASGSGFVTVREPYGD